MIPLSIAKLKLFFAGKRNFSQNLAQKKNVFVESLDLIKQLFDSRLLEMRQVIAM